MATAAQRAAQKKPSARRKPSAYQRLENAAARTRFQPQRRALRGELNVSSQVQRNIHNWFGNTAAEIQQAKNQALQAYAGAGTALRADADRSSQVDAANRQQIDTTAREDAARRGAVVGDTSQVGAQAEAARRTLSDANLTRVTSQGLSAGDYLNTRGIANSQQELVAHSNESNHRASVRRQLTDLKGQEGDFRVTFRAQTQADERKYQLEKGALGLKAGQLGVAQQNANTKSTGVANQLTLGTQKNGIAQQNANTNQFKAHHPGNSAAQRRARRRDAAQRRNHTGPYAPGKGQKPPKPAYTTAQRQGLRSGFDRALAQIRGADKAHKLPSGTTAVLDTLQSGNKGLPRDLAYAAYDAYRHNGVTLKVRNQIAKKYGIYLPLSSTSGSGQGTH